MSYENLSIAQLQSSLQDLEALIKNTEEDLKGYKDEKEKIKLQIVTLTDQRPLDVPTPQALFYKTEEGRLKLRSMTRMDLYSFFQDESNQLSTKEKRDEAVLYLRRTFTTAVVPLEVINRALLANNFKLAPTYLMIKAWLQAGSPLKFFWKPPGKKSHSYRMLWHYEKNDWEEKKRKESKDTSPKPNLFLPLSTPIILELQFLAVLQDRKKSGDRTMMEKDMDLSLCQDEKMGCSEMESTFNTALNIQNEKLSISLC
jgi:hypothetical protein